MSRFDFPSHFTSEQKELIYNHVFDLSRSGNLFSKIKYHLGRLWIHLTGNQKHSSEAKKLVLTPEQMAVIFDCLRINPKWKEKHFNYSDKISTIYSQLFEQACRDGNLSVIQLIWNNNKDLFSKKDALNNNHTLHLSSNSIPALNYLIELNKEHSLFSRDDHMEALQAIVTKEDFNQESFDLVLASLGNLTNKEVISVLDSALDKNDLRVNQLITNPIIKNVMKKELVDSWLDTAIKNAEQEANPPVGYHLTLFTSTRAQEKLQKIRLFLKVVNA